LASTAQLHQIGRNCNGAFEFLWGGSNVVNSPSEAAIVIDPETTFRYAVVEQALMAVHGFVEKKKAAFRARLIHFQRLKMVPASPGKGRRIAYRREDIFRWAVALEFAEFGMDPAEIKKLLDLNWFRIGPAILDATDGADKHLFFHPSFLGRLSPEDERETAAKPGAPYSVTIAIIADLADLDKQAKTDQARASLDRFRARYGMINLSRLRRKVEANLVVFS
jgi:hypothetical protein